SGSPAPPAAGAARGARAARSVSIPPAASARGASGVAAIGTRHAPDTAGASARTRVTGAGTPVAVPPLRAGRFSTLVAGRPPGRAHAVALPPVPLTGP